MNSNDLGDRTEAVVLSVLVRVGYTVLVPFGVARYDLAIDSRDGSGIKTVQCKTARLERGSLVFRAHSTDRRSGTRRGYRGEVDLFGVWCSSLPGSAYLVPVEDVTETMGYLRVEQPLNGQAKGIRWAIEYEVKGL